MPRLFTSSEKILVVRSGSFVFGVVGGIGIHMKTTGDGYSRVGGHEFLLTGAATKNQCTKRDGAQALHDHFSILMDERALRSKMFF